MDTTAKGDRLESLIYDYFKQLIEEGSFWAKKDCCAIFKKKGYYSEPRKRNIIFDVSIEMTLPGQNTYSCVLLIECKNYNHSVPVDDIEEFTMKLQQVGLGNAKGIIASTNSFQSGVLENAKSYGIGLLRYYDKDCLDWVLTRSPSSVASPALVATGWSNAYQGIHNQAHISRYFDCYGYVDDVYTNSLRQFINLIVEQGVDDKNINQLETLKNKPPVLMSLVPYVNSEAIEKLSQVLLQDVGVEGAVQLNTLCQSVLKKYNLNVRRNTALAPGELGCISFNPLEILIDDDQAETEQRIRFTLAHELGHFFLGHEKYMQGEKCHESDVDMENVPEIEVKDIKRMEWQANYFASCLLLPKGELVKAFIMEAEKHELIDKGHGWLYLDNQVCNLEMFYNVTTPLMELFKVSRSVIKIRLKNLGFINDVSRIPKSFKGSLQHVYFE